MKNYYLCILLFFHFSYAFSQDKVEVSGVIIDEFDTPIPDALVKINWSDFGLLSKNDGSFSITVNPTDTLVIKHLSFETKAVIVSNFKKLNYITIKLTAKSFELGEVEINNWGTWQDFKYKIKNMNSDSIRRTGEYQLATMFSSSNVDYFKPIPYNVLESTIIPKSVHRQLNPYNTKFASLSNFLLNKSSTSIPSKIQKERQQELILKENQHRYNEEYVGRILNIEGKELHSFKIFCDYSINIKQSDYNMIRQIKSLYAEWNKIEDAVVPDSIPSLPQFVD